MWKTLLRVEVKDGKEIEGRVSAEACRFDSRTDLQ